VDVVETQRIRFEGGPFKFGFRTIPLERVGRISDVRVYEGDRPYRPGSGDPYTFETWIENNELNVRWYFPPTSNSVHTFVLTYTAEQTVRIYEGGDQLWWAAFSDLSYPVQAAKITVHLPAGVQEVQKAAAYGVRAQVTVVNPQTVLFEAQEAIRPGQRFEVRVQFPHGVVQAPPPPWQAAFDAQAAAEERRQRIATVANLILGFIGLLVLTVGVAGLFVLWYTRGRDAPVALVADYLPNPPDDLPPGVAGTLLDEYADMQDIIATIVDLARRGVIKMTEVQEKGFLGIGFRRDYVFERQEHQETLRPYEEALLRKLFRGRSKVKLSALKHKFYRAIPEIQEQLYDEVVKLGFFPRSPESTRRLYKILGTVGLFGAFGLGFFSIFLASVAGAVFCLPFSMGVVSLGLLLLARVMPRKTPKGSEAAARWRAFKRYLENIETYTDLEQAKDIFDKYLPYAIAFGLADEWVRKFAAVDAPAPPWYEPVGRPVIIGTGWPYGPYHGHPARGGPVFIPGGGVEPRSEPHGGGGMPDLQRTSDRMAGGLQSISDGLASMLNVAGSILASAPSSSGGGGGWSGGGGGFGGGGGGSGGGGGGFG